jgi:hypothetical protein
LRLGRAARRQSAAWAGRRIRRASRTAAALAQAHDIWRATRPRRLVAVTGTLPLERRSTQPPSRYCRLFSRALRSSSKPCRPAARSCARKGELAGRRRVRGCGAIADVRRSAAGLWSGKHGHTRSVRGDSWPHAAGCDCRMAASSRAYRVQAWCRGRRRRCVRARPRVARRNVPVLRADAEPRRQATPPSISAGGDVDVAHAPGAPSAVDDVAVGVEGDAELELASWPEEVRLMPPGTGP